MPRFVPPMYGKVRRKVPPRPTRRVAAPQPAPTPEKVEAEAPPEKKATKKKATKKKATKKKAAAKKAPAKKATKKKAAAKKAPAKKPSKKKASKKKSTKKASKKKASKKAKGLKWDESMTQKELYRLAKDAGLEVRSKDWKDEIIDAIKKHNKKAAK